MRLEHNTLYPMKFRSIFNRINPWIGLIASLCIIIPSLYDILDEPLKITNDHFFLAVGVFFMILFLKQIFDRIVNLEGMD